MNDPRGILILDFGGQYTQLIARRVRECGVYSAVLPYTASLDDVRDANPVGIILSGGPASVLDDGAPTIDPGIFSLEILSVDGHEKRGQYVSTHLHLNVTYLFEADPGAPLRCKPDENTGVAWIPIDELSEKVSEPWFLERIYSKLIKKSTG